MHPSRKACRCEIEFMGLLNDTFSPTFVLLAKLSSFRQIPVDLDEKGNTKSQLNTVIEWKKEMRLEWLERKAEKRERNYL